VSPVEGWTPNGAQNSVMASREPVAKVQSAPMRCRYAAMTAGVSVAGSVVTSSKRASGAFFLSSNIRPV
jgi:hypothetical protein